MLQLCLRNDIAIKYWPRKLTYLFRISEIIYSLLFKKLFKKTIS